MRYGKVALTLSLFLSVSWTGCQQHSPDGDDSPVLSAASPAPRPAPIPRPMPAPIPSPTPVPVPAPTPVPLPAPAPGTSTDLITYPNGHPISTETTVSTILTMENQVLTLINNHRVAIGKSALIHHAGFRKCARAHSKHQAIHGFVAHVNPEGDSPIGRKQKNNISGFAFIGENITAGPSTATAAYNAWMNSSGHKQQLEGSAWTHTGLGYWAGGSYGKYYTQMFAK